MKFITLTWTSDEADWAPHAVVEITEEVKKGILARRELFQMVRKSAPNLKSLSFEDTSAKFYETLSLEELISEEQVDELDRQGLLKVPDSFSMEANPLGVELPRLMIVEEGFYWRASDKHTSASCESELMPFDLLTEITEEVKKTMAKMADPEELAYGDLVECLRTLQQTLWPDGDRDHEWTADTMASVAGVLTDAGLGPDMGGS